MLFSPGKEDVAIDWFKPMKARTSAQLPETVCNPVPDGLAPYHAAEYTVPLQKTTNGIPLSTIEYH